MVNKDLRDPVFIRLRMIDRLRAIGINDEVVLSAMARVPRHRFIDAGLFGQAYEDTSLPIGMLQTISKPSVVARMIELLRQPHEDKPLMHKVLEIGTGCGYQVAILAELAKQVFSVERLQVLYNKARHNLLELRRDNLRLILGDGMLGHPPNAPYDGIIAAASGEQLPPAWLDQLAPGGRLVAPMQCGGPHSRQALMVVDRRLDGTLIHSIHETVRFVPLKSGVI
jgi:protein-L-isoaspartate(D-aspartate) O-methyltransferase